MTRTVNTTGLEHIKRWEGLKLTAYLCPAGKLTIGYGHTSAAGLPLVTRMMTISKAQAELILKRDLAQFEQAVSESVAVKLNDNQFAVLVSFAFNIGIDHFKKSTLLKKLNKGDYAAVPGELMKWVKATHPNTGKKQTIAGLVNRRAAESGLWVKGAFVSSAYVMSTADKQNAILKPEVVGPAIGALSGMTGFAAGNGPAQWAFAAIMVGAFLFGAVYFAARLKNQSA